LPSAKIHNLSDFSKQIKKKHLQKKGTKIEIAHNGGHLLMGETYAKPKRKKTTNRPDQDSTQLSSLHLTGILRLRYLSSIAVAFQIEFVLAAKQCYPFAFV